MIRDEAKPIYVSAEEGSDLVPFRKWTVGGVRGPNRVHAIWFSDGSVFDCVNGWRPDSPYRKPIIRVLMGRAVINA